MTELKILEAELLAVMTRLNAIKNEKFEYKNKRQEEFFNQLDDEIKAKWGDAETEAWRAVSVAQLRFDDMKEKIALESDAHLYPIGTKLVEWKVNRYIFPNRKEKTGRIGIVEIFTNESRQSKIIRWGKAKRGDFVVRILKRNWEPSTNCETNKWNIENYWFPEGVDPNQQKKDT